MFSLGHLQTASTVVKNNDKQQGRYWMNTRFFISNTFISNTRLKLAKNEANAKEDPEAELLLIENY